MDFPIEADWTQQAPASAGRGERENVPEGVHEFVIKQVVEDAEKLELRLVHDDNRYGWVFLTIPKPPKFAWQGKLVGQLAACLSLTPEQWAATEPGDVAGNRVTAQIQHRQSGDRLYVNVWAFLPAEPRPAPYPGKPPAAKPPVARTPHQKVKAAAKAAGVPDDEIPF